MKAELTIPDELVNRIVDQVVVRLDEKIRDPLMDVEQLANYLNVPKGWVYERTRDKTTRFPCVKIGKYVRFNLPEVLEWLKKQG